MPVHREQFEHVSWIGVDLNSTGHLAVIAHPGSHKVIFCGEDIQQLHLRYSLAIEKCRRSGRHKQARRLKHREHNLMREICTGVSRVLLSEARLLGAGIKFERLSGKKPRRLAGRLFPRDNTFYCYWFVRLQKIVERKAVSGGIPVTFVDPSGSSKRCSTCGGEGFRKRKVFECCKCGMTCHVDANAAYNIAMTPALQEITGAGYRVPPPPASSPGVTPETDLPLMPWEDIAGPFWAHPPTRTLPENTGKEPA